MRYLLLFAAAFALAADKKPVPLDPARVKARAFAEATAAFDSYVFSGAAFPGERLKSAPELKDALGPGANYSVAFFTAELRTVSVAEKPGPYAVRLLIRPRGGPQLVRFATLFRTSEEVPADRRFGPDDLADFAKGMGVDAEVVKQNAALIQDRLKKRTFGEWSRDPEAARLLAGLALSKPGKGPVHSYDNAYAVERQ
jgi:hypothetical protein